MVFTEADKAKLISNIEEMVAYIKESIQPRVNDEIEVHFGGKHTCIRSGSVTDEYHLKVTPKCIEYAVKFGPYGNFGEKGSRNLASSINRITEYPEFMLDFVKNWFDIKCRLNTAVSEQEDALKAIYEFKV